MEVAEMQELSKGAIRAQLDRLTRSDTLKRSRRLQQFLRYITELTLAGDASKINEYLLGVEVFERGADYNAADDSIVRRQAHALRHKLAEYYSGEGKHDPIRIEIPLGHYVPAFEPNTAAEASDESAPTKEESIEPKRSPVYTALLLAVLGLFFMGLAFWLGRESAPRGSGAGRISLSASPAISELWGPWLTADQGPVIVFSSPLSAVVKHFPDELAAGSYPPRMAMPPEMEQEFRSKLQLGNTGHLYLSPSSADTKGGESVGAVQLAALFASRGFAVQATTASMLSWENFRQQNLILLGHNEQNSWMDPLLDRYPLRLQATTSNLQRRIVNTAPEPGEPEYFEISYAGSEEESTMEYALVSMLPGTDGLHDLLLVSGLNTQATLMAIEFLTKEERAAQLMDELRAKAPEHNGPWRFQAVLRAEVREGVPTGGSIELTRVLEE